uniref:Uncharacterized protein n=1 Tax=Romanomermis culicivorax TaxID=13658 RepID=A0A915HTJ6_ROMCU
IFRSGKLHAETELIHIVCQHNRKISRKADSIYDRQNIKDEGILVNWKKRESSCHLKRPQPKSEKRLFSTPEAKIGKEDALAMMIEALEAETFSGCQLDGKDGIDKSVNAIDNSRLDNNAKHGPLFVPNDKKWNPTINMTNQKRNEILRRRFLEFCS